MPPAISDDENSDSNELAVLTPPKREKKPVKYADVKEDEDDDVKDEDVKEDLNGDAANGDEDEDDEDGEEGGDEYVVEKILSHMIGEDGKPRFEVKWEGFEKKADRTWEPEENLRGTADVILEEYLASIGGHQELFQDNEKALKGKKRGRPSAGNGTPASNKKRKNAADHPLDTDAPASRKLAWKPPTGSWEDHIDTIEMTRDEGGQLVVWLTWKNGQKTQHSTQQAYTRAPQRMLKFYESKINFTSS